MTCKWVETTLSALIQSGDAHLQTGPFGTALKAAEYADQGVPLISVREIREGYFVVGEETPRVSEQTTKRLPKFILEGGDIVFARKGGIDRNALVYPRQHGWFLGSDGIRLRLSQKHDGRFFSYQMRSPSTRAWLLQNSEGTTMASLNQEILGRVPIIVPPLDEQKSIAAVLGALDDKIELNRRMNATLEAMARALFQSWFVDFDPVRAKMEGRTLYGMDASTADLFPAAFTDSPLGPIPVGWQIRPLDAVAEFTNGLAMQKYPPDEGGSLPVIKIAELNRGVTAASDRASTKVPRKYIVGNGDMLFSWSGSLLVTLWSGGLGALNQHLFKVVSTEYPQWFYYFWTLHHLPDFQRIAAGKATTMGHIQRHHLTAALTVVPPNELLAQINRTMAPLLEHVVANDLESRTLTALRDALLPKLLSGEVRVREAVRAVEAAV